MARGIKRFSEVFFFFALLRFRLKLQYIEIVFEQLQLLVLLQVKSINTIGTSKNQAIVLQYIFHVINSIVVLSDALLLVAIRM